MGVADFVARGTGAFASRFSCTLDETTVGGKILPPWEALDIMHFVEQHEAEDLADTWDRLQQIQRVGVMVLGGFDEDRQLSTATHLAERLRGRKAFPGYREMLDSVGPKLLRRGFSPGIVRTACREVWNGTLTAD